MSNRNEKNGITKKTERIEKMEISLSVATNLSDSGWLINNFRF